MDDGGVSARNFLISPVWYFLTPHKPDILHFLPFRHCTQFRVALSSKTIEENVRNSFGFRWILPIGKAAGKPYDFLWFFSVCSLWDP